MLHASSFKDELFVCAKIEEGKAIKYFIDDNFTISPRSHSLEVKLHDARKLN